jgi:hypothetical protein
MEKSFIHKRMDLPALYFHIVGGVTTMPEMIWRMSWVVGIEEEPLPALYKESFYFLPIYNVIREL